MSHRIHNPVSIHFSEAGRPEGRTVTISIERSYAPIFGGNRREKTGPYMVKIEELSHGMEISFPTSVTPDFLVAVKELSALADKWNAEDLTPVVMAWDAPPSEPDDQEKNLKPNVLMNMEKWQ